MASQCSNIQSLACSKNSEWDLMNDDDDDVDLKPGAVIESKKPAKYTVIELLGEGGFGAVYKVYCGDDKSKEYAMKVEKNHERRLHSKLKMEASLRFEGNIEFCGKIRIPETKAIIYSTKPGVLLKKRPGADRGARCHFTPLQDRGKKPAFTFVVMMLVGKNLAELKGRQKVFSEVTGLGCALQTLESCEDLNKIGYIHRDLKPANFAIGLENRRLIYMLDFGIARCILNSKGELKAPRETMKFKGTVKFASLNCHNRKELGSVDDMESWFYMSMDLMNPQGLPWKSEKDKEIVKKKKESSRINPEQLIGPLKCKKELSTIWKYITTLGYHDKTADYSYVYQLLTRGVSACGGSVNDKYDWE